jgi:uncharacterized protein YgbK (DUF1537 family)
VIGGTFGILADDLTGANDTGVQFSRVKARVLALLSLERLPGHIAGTWDILVLNMGTRNVPPVEARSRVRQALRTLKSAGVPAVYHKIDSTLRGNWPLELEEILEGREGPAFLAPAFPLNGRTVEGGELRVGGVPLGQSEAARDGLSPVRASRVAEFLTGALAGASRDIGLSLLARGPAEVSRFAERETRAGARVLICDAREQEHLAVLAEAALPMLPHAVLSGSAGLARELAGKLRFESAPDQSADSPRRGPVLVIAGSRSRVTSGQVARLMERFRPLRVEIDPESVDGTWDAARRRALAEDLLGRRGPSDGLWLAAIGPGAEVESARFHERSLRLNELLGELASQALESRPLSGLVLTGGDVALAVLEALRAVGVHLGEEILPGIPLGRVVGGPHEGLAIVTKAGAFGSPNALAAAVEALRGGPHGAAEP